MEGLGLRLFRARRSPYPVMVAIIGILMIVRILLYAYYTAITAWQVHLNYTVECQIFYSLGFRI